MYDRQEGQEQRGFGITIRELYLSTSTMHTQGSERRGIPQGRQQARDNRQQRGVHWSHKLFRIFGPRGQQQTELMLI